MRSLSKQPRRIKSYFNSHKLDYIKKSFLIYCRVNKLAGDILGDSEAKFARIVQCPYVAMAALATAFAQSLHSPIELDLKCLSVYRGVVRRQELRYSSPQSVLIEDFAHPPTAIAHTIAAVKAAYPEHRLVCCFEPRSNTAQKAIFQDAFVDAFEAADEVLLGAVFRAERLASDERLNMTMIASILSLQGKRAQAFESNLALFAYLQNEHSANKESTVYLFCTNGAFYGIISKAVSWLESQELTTAGTAD